FIGNQIAECGIATNNTYVGLAIAPNVNDFTISGNFFGNLFGVPTNKPQYAILVNAGTSDRYTMSDNTCLIGDFVAGCISDGGTGTNTIVGPNAPTSTAPVKNLNAYPVTYDLNGSQVVTPHMVKGAGTASGAGTLN